MSTNNLLIEVKVYLTPTSFRITRYYAIMRGVPNRVRATGLQAARDYSIVHRTCFES